MYKRPYRVTTDSAHDKPIAPNVLDRCFDGWRVNQAWVADITYIATGEGWLYLAVIMDLASRRIVGWSMSERIKADSSLPSVEVGVLAAQTVCGTDPAFGPWQPVRQRHPPAVDQRLRDDSIDEPESQLLGQRGDGELLQDTEGRAYPSASLRHPRACEARYR